MSVGKSQDETSCRDYLSIHDAADQTGSKNARPLMILICHILPRTTSSNNKLG